MIKIRCIQAMTILLATSLIGRSAQKIPIAFSDYERELAAYRDNFIGMYTSNAFDDTESQMEISEEEEISYDQHTAELTRYTDLSGKCLRYRVDLYGETMREVINYYFCDDFIAVSVVQDYYSSWILSAGYSDILYTTMENYIIVGEDVYIVHENGTFEMTKKEKAGILLPDEMEIL